MTEQLTRDELAGMTAEQIVAAKEAGRLDTLTGGRRAEDVAVLDKARTGSGLLTRQDVAHLWQLGEAELITAAQRDGRITDTTENTDTTEKEND